MGWELAGNIRGPAGPAGGGGGATAKRLTTNAPTSLTAYSSISELEFTLAANAAYAFDWYLYFTAAAATTGIGLQLAGTTLLNSMRAGIEIATSVTARTTSVVTALLTPLLTTGSAGATPLMAVIHGTILTGATDGTLVPQFRSEVAGSNVTILTGSYGTLAAVA